ncbi:hypothetical protein QYE76_018177 [Lolium multiflorum]|uniref:Uncharacterized protein n=1 Tax=Lolium multiflorum TaxID=4521 RepID=A0AAD8VEF5_LOLMU|nr:hypothetical protein QYE76_018177 [Lolium multiflorum]
MSERKSVLLATKSEWREVKDNPSTTIHYVLICKGLSSETNDLTNIPSSLLSLLKEFQDVFPDELPHGLPPLRGIEHRIDLIPGAPLPNRAAYRTNPEDTKEIQRQIQDLLAKGYVRESLSPCAVPVILVPKPDETQRMCMDCRPINAITVRYRHPIPRLDDMLDELSGATIFSKIDLRDAGWPSDTSSPRPTSPPSGPMTRARAKAIHDKVNSLLTTLDLDTPLDGLLPHADVLCVIRYKAHQDPGEDETSWSREGEEQRNLEMNMKPKPTSPEERQGREGRWPVQSPVRPDPRPDAPATGPVNRAQTGPTPSYRTTTGPRTGLFAESRLAAGRPDP